MKNIKLDLTHPHNYKIEIIDDLPAKPGSMEQIYFPGAEKEGGKDGLIVKVIPNEGAPWIGIFAFGYPSPKALTKVLSCPDRQFLCVISLGKGYFVQVDNPNNWEEAKAYPIIDARAITETPILLFADFTALTAYGDEGVIWRTPDLSWDGLKITEITSGRVKGLAWDSVQGREVGFFIDLKTGQYEGGSSPPHTKKETEK